MGILIPIGFLGLLASIWFNCIQYKQIMWRLDFISDILMKTRVELGRVDSKLNNLS